MIAPDFIDSIPDIIRNQNWTVQTTVKVNGAAVTPVSSLCKIQNSLGTTSITSSILGNVVTTTLTPAQSAALEAGYWDMDLYVKLPDTSIIRLWSTKVRVFKGQAEGLV